MLSYNSYLQPFWAMIILLNQQGWIQLLNTKLSSCGLLLSSISQKVLKCRDYHLPQPLELIVDT